MRRARLLGPLLGLFLLASHLCASPNDVQPSQVIHWQGIAAKLLDPYQVELKLYLRTEQEFSIYQEKLNLRSKNYLSIMWLLTI